METYSHGTGMNARTLLLFGLFSAGDVLCVVFTLIGIKVFVDQPSSQRGMRLISLGTRSLGGIQHQGYFISGGVGRWTGFPELVIYYSWWFGKLPTLRQNGPMSDESHGSTRTPPVSGDAAGFLATERRFFGLRSVKCPLLAS